MHEIHVKSNNPERFYASLDISNGIKSDELIKWLEDLAWRPHRGFSNQPDVVLDITLVDTELRVSLKNLFSEMNQV